VANRYLVASGNYTSTSVWSATSGGASGASVPGSFDDVFIENNFTLTVDSNSNAQSVTHSYGTLIVSGNRTLGISRAYTFSGTSSKIVSMHASTASYFNFPSVSGFQRGFTYAVGANNILISPGVGSITGSASSTSPIVIESPVSVDWPAINLTFFGSNGTIDIKGANSTFTNFSVASASGQFTSNLTFEAGKTYTMLGTFSMSGVTGVPLIVDTTSSGSQVTISKSSGSGTADYVTMRDNSATGGATFTATNSTNTSGNSGWIFPILRTKTQTATARIQKGLAKTQTATARIATPTEYSRGSYSSIPSNAALLTTNYSSSEITDVSTVDGIFVDLMIDDVYGIHQFNHKGTNNTNQIHPTWTGRIAKPAASVNVKMEIYNRTSGLWELLDTNNSAAANATITLQGHVTTSLSDYYDALYYVAVRVYQ